MFYDIYSQLCADRGVSPSRAAVEMGFYRSSVSYWKKSGGSPEKSSLKKMSEYFNVPIGVLTGTEELTPTEDDKTPTRAKTSQKASSSVKPLPTQEALPSSQVTVSGETKETRRKQHRAQPAAEKQSEATEKDEGNTGQYSKAVAASHEDTWIDNQNPPTWGDDFLSAMELARACQYTDNAQQGPSIEPGERIRLLRRQLGLSVDYVAKAVRVDRKTLLMWESGEIKNIRRYKLGKLAKVLETTVDYLLGREDIEFGRAEDFDLEPFIEILKTRGECLAMLMISRDMSREDIELTINFMRSLKASD